MWGWIGMGSVVCGCAGGGGDHGVLCVCAWCGVCVHEWCMCMK